MISLSEGSGSQVRRSLSAPAVVNVVLGILFAIAGLGFGSAVLSESPIGIGLITVGVIAAIGSFGAAACGFGARSHIVGDQVDVGSMARSHQRSKVVVWFTGLAGAAALAVEVVISLSGARMGTPILGLSVVIVFGALGTILTSGQKIARLAALSSAHA